MWVSGDEHGIRILGSHSSSHPIEGYETHYQCLGYHRYNNEFADENTEPSG
jgi:hypothetical protein